jgi:hypothetical protein
LHGYINESNDNRNVNELILLLNDELGYNLNADNDVQKVHIFCNGLSARLQLDLLKTSKSETELLRSYLVKQPAINSSWGTVE